MIKDILWVWLVLGLTIGAMIYFPEYPTVLILGFSLFILSIFLFDRRN